ncbi:hypothetical protein GCM10007906_25890 [Vibrio hyugaensis]|uniref:Uncharacterized protein n=1 Tax=Vibrio hyugaensis TaxID=1534743 RepID=A0ABQ5Y1Y2_9VIBR|nr:MULTISPECIES: hypothetical protein [Vibrio]GLR05001.1 hypothetical protein GCM10007906_25890 [Vibrio hyugaensis]
MQVNNTFRLQIEEALCKTQFSLEDVEITYPSYGELVSIKFKHHDGFKISLEEIEYQETLQLHRDMEDEMLAPMRGTHYGEPDTKTVTKNKYVSTESPGSVKATDTISFLNLTSFIQRLPVWANNIEAELLSIYNQTEYSDAELEKQVEAIFPHDIDKPNQKFTENEVTSLKENLERLYQRVEELQEQCDISQAKIEALRSAIDKASENAPKYPKSMWLKLNKGKIKETLINIFKSEEGRKFLLKVVEKIALN